MRLAFTMRRAARTMFMTSVTTSVAFLATFFSPIMPIRAFGIYTAILVPMVFILTCMILPPAVIIYDNHFKELFCCKKTGDSNVEKSITKIGGPTDGQTARGLMNANEEHGSGEPGSGDRLV